MNERTKERINAHNHSTETFLQPYCWWFDVALRGVVCGEPQAKNVLMKIYKIFSLVRFLKKHFHINIYCVREFGLWIAVYAFCSVCKSNLRLCLLSFKISNVDDIKSESKNTYTSLFFASVIFAAQHSCHMKWTVFAGSTCFFIIISHVSFVVVCCCCSSLDICFCSIIGYFLSLFHIDMMMCKCAYTNTHCVLHWMQTKIFLFVIHFMIMLCWCWFLILFFLPIKNDWIYCFSFSHLESIFPYHVVPFLWNAVKGKEQRHKTIAQMDRTKAKNI